MGKSEIFYVINWWNSIWRSLRRTLVRLCRYGANAEFSNSLWQFCENVIQFVILNLPIKTDLLLGTLPHL